MRDCAVDIDGVASEAFGIGIGKARQVADKQLVGLAVYLDFRTRIIRRIGLRNLDHNALAFFPRWQCHVESGTETLQFLRHFDLVADEYDLPMYFAGANADVLEQADVYRIIEKRMEVQQYVYARVLDRPDVPQHVGRFRVDGLRFERYVEPLQTVGDGPAKQRRIGLARSCHRD